MSTRRKPYPNELYHYGVKGMKWKEHKYGNLTAEEYYERVRQKLAQVRARTNKNDKTPAENRPSGKIPNQTGVNYRKELANQEDKRQKQEAARKSAQMEIRRHREHAVDNMRRDLRKAITGRSTGELSDKQRAVAKTKHEDLERSRQKADYEKSFAREGQRKAREAHSKQIRDQIVNRDNKRAADIKKRAQLEAADQKARKDAKRRIMMKRSEATAREIGSKAEKALRNAYGDTLNLMKNRKKIASNVRSQASKAAKQIRKSLKSASTTAKATSTNNGKKANGPATNAANATKNKKAATNAAKNKKAANSNRKLTSSSARERQAARDIWEKGTYGNGEDRRRNLKKAGINYDRTQDRINKTLDNYQKTGKMDWDYYDRVQAKKKAKKKNSSGKKTSSGKKAR